QICEGLRVIDAHPGYAYLGALGPRLGDFAPQRLPPGAGIGGGGVNPYVAMWRLLFDVFAGAGTTENPGLKPTVCSSDCSPSMARPPPERSTGTRCDATSTTVVST